MADYSGGGRRRGGPIPQQQKPQPLKGFVTPNSATAAAAAAANARTQAQRASNSTPSRTHHRSPGSNGMGIKSGMTVEDLKRLTQQRMQQKAASAPAPAPVSGPVPVPDAGRQAPVPASMNVLPKAGMTVQELKQLTSLRLATQNIPRQPPANLVVNKGVVPNGTYGGASMMAGNITPKRMSFPPGGRSASPIAPGLVMNRGRMPRGYDLQHQQQQLQQKHHRAMLQAQYNMYGMPQNVAAMHAAAQMHGVPGMDDYSSLEMNSTTSQDINDFRRAVLDLDEDITYGNGAYDDQDPHYLVHQINSLQFSDDSFPPPPPAPVDDDEDEDGNASFIATSSMPSWSPPPMRSKKLDSSVVPPPPPVGFYNQSINNSYYTSATSKEDASRDQNAVIAPPPGLARRPSMTVPWQVAEAVLNTPQTASNRKQLVSPTSSGTSAAAQLSRQRSGATLAAAGQPPTLTPSTSTGAAGGRRGSFGNAAEFFKFRRRSKSRLELARDLSNFGAAGAVTEADGVPLKGNVYGSYGSTNTMMMPGIDETTAGDNLSTVAHLDTEDGGNSFNDDDEDQGDESDVVEFDERESSFVNFYQQAGIGNLSIPPPPPPPLEEEEEQEQEQAGNGLPMMSPNGAKLRKVAELARRGSLSNEDKTRVKDEIIQSSLGIGASNAARIFLTQQAPAVQQRERTASNADQRPPVSPPVAAPPGFQRMSSTPPRDTPKNTMPKTLPAGIVRSSSFGVTTRNSPPTNLMMTPGALSPTSAASLEERLASAAQKVADYASKGDMVGFQKAMEELDQLRNETNQKLMNQKK